MKRLGFFSFARWSLPMAASLLVVILTSCQFGDTPAFYLSFHQIPSPSEIVDRNMFITISSADGSQEEIVARYPLFDSARIVQVEKIPGNIAGKYGLKLHLDRQGVPAWHELTVYKRTSSFIAVMDGFCLGIVEFSSSADQPGVLATSQLWSEYEADKIIEHVEANYRLAGKK